MRPVVYCPPPPSPHTPPLISFHYDPSLLTALLLSGDITSVDTATRMTGASVWLTRDPPLPVAANLGRDLWLRWGRTCVARVPQGSAVTNASL